MRAKQWRDIKDYLLTDRDLAPSTTEDVLRKLRHQERHGLDLQRGPTRRQWRAFIAAKKEAGCGPAGIRHHVVALRHLLAMRGREWPELELPTEPHPVRPLLADDVLTSILDYDRDSSPLFSATARSIFRATFYWVLRPPSEAYALKLADLDVQRRRLSVWQDKLDVRDTQTLKPWEVDVGREYLEQVRPRVLEATRACRRGGESDAFFLDPRTGRAFQSREALGMFLRRSIKKVSPSARVYDLRISAISWVYSQTRDLEYTARRARHRDPKTTRYYLRAFFDLMRDVEQDVRPFDGRMLREPAEA